MAVGRKISGSRNLVLFICIYIILCGIFNSKTRKTSRISIWEKLCVCVEVTNAINFFKAFKRRRTSKQRPLANRLKLIIGLRFILYTSYSVFLIMLSGDVEINPGPRCKEKDSVKCVTINARSLTSLVKFNDSNKTESNLERFQNFVYSEDFDIVCVNETWLSAKVYNVEILHSGYTIVRNDRITRGGHGGVLLGVKTSTFKSVREIEYKHELEVAVAEITTTSNIKMLICSCYRPPDAEKSWMNKFESFLQDVCSRHSKIVIAGDFNLPRACRQLNENGFGGNEHAFVKIKYLTTFPWSK